MREGRLQEIKAGIESLDTGRYYGADMLADALTEKNSEAAELVAEVERLEGRLEAVCAVLSDAEAFDGVVDASKVLEAVRGGQEPEAL
jgi:hypothetical protein